MAAKIRNPKSEIRNKSKIQNSDVENISAFTAFLYWNSEHFGSDLEFRISDLEFDSRAG
jgi:hypothetical protein